MELVNEEEKKEGTEHGDAADKDCTSVNMDEEDNNSMESEEADEELGDLPSDIVEEIGKDCWFETEQELEDALDKAGVGDLPVVLVDGKPRLIMPTFNTMNSQHTIVEISLSIGQKIGGDFRVRRTKSTSPMDGLVILI